MPFIELGRRSEGPGVGFRRPNVVAIAVFLASVGIGILAWMGTGNPVPIVTMAIVGAVLMQAPQVAQQWERGVVLKLGRFVGLRGPGLFWIVPFVDRVSSWIDQRTITTSFAA